MATCLTIHEEWDAIHYPSRPFRKTLTLFRNISKKHLGRNPEAVEIEKVDISSPSETYPMKTFLALLTFWLCATVSAALLFEEAFDYGSVTDDIENVSTWVTGSNVVLYDHDGGLDHPQLNGESGGSIFHDFGSGGRGGETTDADFDPFPSVSAGAEFWISGLIQINQLGGVTLVTFDNGQSVNDWGFGVDASGNVLLIGSDNGNAAASLDTGADVIADGSTHLFISRATLGSGTSPTASTIDFWFNPTDTSSVAGLGTVTFSTGADSKIGRDSGAYTDLGIGMNFQNRVDEIRFGEDLLDVVAIPEPSSLALLGLALIAGCAMRRQR